MRKIMDSLLGRGLCFVFCFFVGASTAGAATASVAANGKDAKNAVFRVIDSSLNVESDKAELCLNLSQPIAIDDRAALASLVSLTEDDAKVDVTSQNLSLTPTDFCLQQLEHGHHYRLVIKHLTNLDDEELEKPVKLSFDVPDRKPLMVFVPPQGAQETDKLPLFAPRDFPSLRVINVTSTRVALYRIKDPKKWALAWQQVTQNNLAPSESLTFAKQNGENLWQGELVFGDKPNTSQTLAVPVPDREPLVPGLYFLSAAPREVAGASALSAGLWFRIGAARATAVRSDDRLYVFATDRETATPLAGATVRVMGRDGASVVEAKTDSAGLAKLPLDHAKKSEDLLVVTEAANGAVDILDGARLQSLAPVGRQEQTRIVPNRSLYGAGDVVVAALWAADAQGALQRIDNSSLKLLRPDDGFYSEQRVPADPRGVQTVRLSLPAGASSGTWSLMWQKDDGQVLARVPVSVGDESFQGKMELHADRAMLDASGAILLTVKAKGADGKPLPWRKGRILMHQGALEQSGWEGYLFGLSDPKQASDIKLTEIMTDGDGTAHVKLTLPLGDDDEEAGRAVTLTAQLDDGPMRAVLTLPARTNAGWVGIKPLVDNGLFPENSVARFSIVAIDANAKRRPAGELYYQIYEEGRNFRWYQAAGHWEYLPLPSHHRIGGGRVLGGGTGDSVVRWPVTAGHYILEIMDAKGAVLARRPFGAGWTQADDATNNDPRLTAAWGPGSLAETHVTVTLAAPAWVAFVAGDGQVQTVVERSLPAGITTLDLAEKNDKKEKKAPTRFWAAAVFKDGRRATVALARSPSAIQPKLDIEAVVPATVTSGGTLNVPVQVSHAVAKGGAVAVSLIAAPDPVTGASLPPVESAPQKVGADGRATFHVPLPTFTGTLKLNLWAWNDQQVGEKALHLAAKEALRVEGALPAQILVGDKVILAVRVSNHGAPEGIYHYAFDLPKGMAAQGALKGTIQLKHGQEKNVTLSLSAKAENAQPVRLDLSGPGNFHVNRSWTCLATAEDTSVWSGLPAKIKGEDYISLPLKTVQKKKEAAFTRGFLIAPFPLPDFLPQVLQTFVVAEPITTTELAHWVYVASQWKAQIAALGLMPEDSLEALRQERLNLLLKRQADDGGFAAWPGDEKEDIVSTAAALPILQDVSEEAAVVGARWLRHKLENTWFDDAERADRAEAVLALSSLRAPIKERARATDPAALRYLADTSRDKPLSSVVASNLALALALVGDQDRARFWMGRAQAALSVPAETLDGTVVWGSFARLAVNPLFGATDLLPAMTKVAVPSSADTPAEAMAFLAAYGATAARYGTWHLQLAGEDKKVYGVWAMPQLEKNAVISLRNPAREERFVLQIEAQTPPKAADHAAVGTVQRTVYGLDGGRIPPEKALKVGTPYLVVMRGTMHFDKDKTKGEDMPLRLVVPKIPAWQTVAAARNNADAFASLWPWMGNGQSALTHVALEGAADAFAWKGKGNWQIAYLIKATQPGSFAVPPVSLFDGEGQALALTQNALRIVVGP